MSIVGALPITLTNGTTADATQVMTDLNFIVSQVNANAAQLVGGNAFAGGSQTINGDVIATLTASQAISNKTLTFTTFNGGTINVPTINSPAIVNPTVTGTLNSGDIVSSGGIRVLGTIAPSVSSNAFQAGAAAWALVIASAAVDQRWYDCVAASGGSLNFRFVNDAFGASSTWLQAVRTGISISSVSIAGQFTVLGDGRTYGNALHNNGGSVSGTTNQYIASGTFTPVASNFVNATAVTPAAARWIRVGNVVTVSGDATVTTAAPGSQTNFDLTTPITFSSGSHTINGVCTNVAAFPAHCGIVGPSGFAGLAVFISNNFTGAAEVWYYTYTYLVDI